MVVEEAVEGCMPRSILEVLRRPGEERMPLCFDLQESPETPRHCGEYTGHDDALEGEALDAAVAAHPRRQYFPLPVTQLDPALVSVRLSTAEVTEQELDESDGMLGERWLIVEVSVRDAEGAWQPSATYRTFPGSEEHAWMSWMEEDAPDGRGEEYLEDDAPEFSPPNNEIGVRVYPSPDGTRALVSISGQNEAPGTGFFMNALVWGSLPTLPEGATTTEGGMSLGVMEGAPSAGSSEDVIADTVQRINAYALTIHGQGNYRVSAGYWAQLLMMDPTNPVLRYNLASAFARLGHVHVALDLLEELKAATGCTRCRERLRRARRDPDFAPLRRDPRFRAATR